MAPNLMALDSAIAVNEALIQLRAIKSVPRRQQALEAELNGKLRAIFRNVSSAALHELETLGHIPAGGADALSFGGDLEEARKLMGQASADSAEEASNYGRDKMVDELQKQASERANTRIQEAIRKNPRRFSRRTVDRIRRDSIGESEDLLRTLRRRVTRNLSRSLDEGRGIREAADELRQEFRRVEDFELRRIARTEINRAQQSAAFLTERELGVEYHQWITAEDERVRESHYRQHNEIVAVGEPFSNGLTRPGDPNGPASEVVNCRCRLAPFILPKDMRPPIGDEPFREGDLVSRIPDPSESGPNSGQSFEDLTPEQLEQGEQQWREESLASLDEDETDAMRRYTFKNDRAVNSYLRGDLEATSGIEKDVATMRRALEKNPTRVPMKVERSIKPDAWGMPDVKTIDDLNERNPIGRVVHQPGFMSTSRAGSHALSFDDISNDGRVLMNLNVPKGTPALDISEISEFPEENEVLLRDGLSYIIRDFKRTGTFNDVLIFEADIIDPT